MARRSERVATGGALLRCALAMAGRNERLRDLIPTRRARGLSGLVWGFLIL